MQMTALNLATKLFSHRRTVAVWGPFIYLDACACKNLSKPVRVMTAVIHEQFYSTCMSTVATMKMNIPVDLLYQSSAATKTCQTTLSIFYTTQYFNMFKVKHLNIKLPVQNLMLSLGLKSKMCFKYN